MTRTREASLLWSLPESALCRPGEPSGTPRPEKTASRRPRLFRAFGVGLGRTGTTSLSEAFGAYRSRHDFEPERAVLEAARLRRGASTAADFARFLRERDARAWAEMESWGGSALYAGELARAFPDARFVVTVRDAFSWTESVLNAGLSRPRPGGPREGLCFACGGALALGRHTISGLAPEIFADEDALFAGLDEALDRLLSVWALNARLIAGLPPERTLVVRTHEIGARLPEIARHVGAAPQAMLVERAHSNRAPVLRGLLARAPRARVARAFKLRCAPLMDRLFAGLTLDAHLARAARAAPAAPARPPARTPAACRGLVNWWLRRAEREETPGRARAALGRALALAPEPDERREIAAALVRAGRPRAAAALAARLVEEGDGDARTRLAAAEAHAALGRAARALAELDAAAGAGRAERHRAAILRRELGDPARAAVELDALIQEAPSAELFHDRGVTAQAAGRPERAVSDFARALDLDPGFLRAYAALAGLLLERGRRASAARVLARALPHETTSACAKDRALLARLRRASAAADAKAPGGILHLIPWHVGDARDVTFRAVELARGLPTLFVEDEPSARRELARFGVDARSKRLVVLTAKPDARVLALALEALASGDAGLMASAGTPAFVDPGAWLVAALRRRGARVEAVGGASALAAALSLSGIEWRDAPTSGFTFACYPRGGGRGDEGRRLAARARRREPVLIFAAADDVARVLALLEPVVAERAVALLLDLTKPRGPERPWAGRVLRGSCARWRTLWPRLLARGPVEDVALLVDA